MDEPIVRVDLIRGMAQFAHQSGAGRDSHGFNWHAPALRTWLLEFDRLEALGTASLESHAAPAGRRHVEARQGAAS